MTAQVDKRALTGAPCFARIPTWARAVQTLQTMSEPPHASRREPASTPHARRARSFASSTPPIATSSAPFLYAVKGGTSTISSTHWRPPFRGHQVELAEALRQVYRIARGRLKTIRQP
jgi:hypothetical protein